MADISQEGGPEWAYLAPLTRKKNFKFDFDSLLVNVRREGEQPANRIDSLQALQRRTGEEMYVRTDIIRFRYDMLREMIGSNSDDFDLFFEAYEGAEPPSGVAIADPPSFRRLLAAIRHLGLPAPENAGETDLPPVLRFFARPRYDPEASAVPEASNTPPRRPRSRGHRVEAPQLENTPSPEGPPGGRPVGYGVDAPEQRDISMTYGDTPPSQSVPVRQHQRVASLRSSEMSVDQPEASAEAEGRSSFFELPKQPPRQPLTFEARVEEGLDYGLSDQAEDPHLVSVHNLYADIAGIPRTNRDPQNPEHAYNPPYSTLSLPPHQTYPTGFVFSQPDKLVYYLADRVGLGKTFAALECIIRLTLILSNGITIDEERDNFARLKERPVHVHPKDHPRFGKLDRCRADTLRRYGFVCPCDEKSPTYSVTRDGDFNTGYMLVLVPLHLLVQWVEQIKRFIRSTVRLPHNRKPFEIKNIHEGKDIGKALKDFINSKPEHYGLGTILVVPTTSAVAPSLKSLCEPSRRELHTHPSFIVFDEMQNIGSTTHDVVLWVKALINRAYVPTHVLALGGTPWKSGPGDFDVIESIIRDPVSWGGWWTKEAYVEYEQRLKKARERLNDSAKRVKALDIIGRGKQGSVQDDEKDILMSHDRILSDYAAQIPLLQRKGGSQYLGGYIPERATAKLVLFRADSEMDQLQKEVAKGYKEYILLGHRKRVSNWSRMPEDTRGPRPKIKDHLISHATSGVDDASRIDVSLVGFAPGLTRLVYERMGTSGQFRAPEANHVFRGTTTREQRQVVMDTEYWDLAPTAFNKVDPRTGETLLHPKISFICSLIDRMLADTEPHVKDGQYLGVFDKKMIIIVPHAFQGLVLVAYLFWKYPSTLNFTFVGASNEPNIERPRLLAPFARDISVPSPEEGRAGDPIVLVSTFAVIGTGLNLTRANYLVITSPAPSRSFETQAFGRIDRQGQYCTVHGYTLLDNGNPVDVTSFHRQRVRTVLTVPPDEIGTGLSFLLEDIDEEDEREPEEDMGGPS